MSCSSKLFSFNADPDHSLRIQEFSNEIFYYCRIEAVVRILQDHCLGGGLWYLSALI